MKKFGVPAIVSINHFVTDSDAEVAAVKAAAEEMGVEAVLATHWAEGSAGTEDLAHKVVALADSGTAQFAPLYPDDLPLWDKVRTIATELYGAADIQADQKVRNQFKDLEAAGFGHLPICMAKTQYSFSTDPALKGAPSGHAVTVRELRLAAGAEFVVAICGDIMTMPGLPRRPAAVDIGLDADGRIDGLF